MSTPKIRSSQLLAEILRIQHWAGGEAIDPDRIYGLMKGFESVIADEVETFGISADQQDLVEDLLEAIEAGSQSPNEMAIKSRLREVGVDESTARTVIKYCWLGERFTEAIQKISAAQGPFLHVETMRQPEDDWFGSLHYCELVDCTEGAHRSMHAVFTAAIPQVGSIIVPENGSPMRVVGVEYVVSSSDPLRKSRYSILIPHVLLQAADDDEEEV